MLNQLRGPCALFFLFAISSCSLLKIKESPRNALDMMKEKDLVGLWQNNKSYLLIKKNGSISYKVDNSERRSCKGELRKKMKFGDCKSVIYESGYILGLEGDNLVIDVGQIAHRWEVQEFPTKDYMVLGDILFHRKGE